MTSGRFLTGAAAPSLLAATLLAGCARPAPPPAPVAERKPDLPAIALKEGPAFPLPAHVESKDIAAGAYSFDRMFEAGSLLFHAAFNGLDGVGSLVREDGSRVARLAPPGPRGPHSQACGECHNMPFRKTITVALSPEQFQALHQAIENRRRLERTIRKMEQLSRRILFKTLPDTRRRKPLPKKVLGLI